MSGQMLDRTSHYHLCMLLVVKVRENYLRCTFNLWNKISVFVLTTSQVCRPDRKTLITSNVRPRRLGLGFEKVCMRGWGPLSPVVTPFFLYLFTVSTLIPSTVLTLINRVHFNNEQVRFKIKDETGAYTGFLLDDFVLNNIFVCLFCVVSLLILAFCRLSVPPG